MEDSFGSKKYNIWTFKKKNANIVINYDEL
jgi:hypothetical protein